VANRGPSLDQSPQFFAALDRFPAAARGRLTWGRGRLSTKCIFIHVSLPSEESSVLFALLSTGKFFVLAWQLSAASGFRSQPVVVALRKKMWQRLRFTRSTDPAVQDKQTVFFRAESCQLAVPADFQPSFQRHKRDAYGTLLESSAPRVRSRPSAMIHLFPKGGGSLIDRRDSPGNCPRKRHLQKVPAAGIGRIRCGRPLTIGPTRGKVMDRQSCWMQGLVCRKGTDPGASRYYG
jgi:hypothetical protein